MEPDSGGGAVVGVRFYCGINETKWNKHPAAPGLYACIAPVYGASTLTKVENRVSVPAGVYVLQDSGAFSDGPGQRLRFDDALRRQMEHAEKWGYYGQMMHYASYDLLIDEKWEGGQRRKARWSVSDAEAATDETVAAAQYYSEHRNGLPLVLSAQGVDAGQYLRCVGRVIPWMDCERDILGLGGWCITGKMPKQMMPVFRETIRVVVPFAAREGVQWIHIWGVIYPPALGELLWMCDRYGIQLSTDSAGPTLKPVFGQWGYGEWRDNDFQQPPVEMRGLYRAWHVHATRLWLDNLENTRWYREPRVHTRYRRHYVQMGLW